MKFFLTLFLILFFIGCNKNNKTINIKLKYTSKNNISFDKRYYTIRSSVSKNNFPNYYNFLLKKYTGIPENDSSAITQLTGNYNKFKYDLFINKFISKDEYSNLKIDSLKEKKKPENSILTTLIYFKNKKQYIIIDEDNNKDFSNDKINEFDENFEKETIKLNTYNFKFWLNIDTTIAHYSKKIIIDPTSIYNYYKNSKETNAYNLLFRYEKHWTGTFSVNNKKFDIAIQGINPYFNILIKPDFLLFSKNNYYANRNFSYSLKDTVSLDDSLFVLQKFDTKKSTFLLKKIVNNGSFKSYKIGNKLDNYLMKDIYGKEFNLLTKTKKYTLIDFWGTWCNPCKELMPDLKRMNKNFSKSLNIIGVAYDKEIDNVKEYLKVNNISWKNSFFNIKRKKGIIRDIKITQYPTFILIDNNNRQIIYKGAGKESLNEIEEILKNQKHTF